eukprot:gene15054-16607_t
MSELAAKLAHRNAVNEGEAKPNMREITNVYVEFKEFTRKQIQEYERIFNKYDTNGDNHLDQNELQIMMEKLDAPQTYLGLKNMIKEVDEDLDGKISFREFLMVFRKAAEGLLEEGSGLYILATMNEIDVDETGVGGAKEFFEAKMMQAQAGSKYEMEIRLEQEEKKKETHAKKLRQEAFQNKKSAFQSF